MTTNGAKKPSLSFTDNFVQIIDGQSTPTSKTRHGVNPATLEAKAEVPVATQENLDKAAEAGKRAFKKWSKVPAEERLKAVLAWADAVDALKDEFRDLLISEQGKPVRCHIYCTVTQGFTVLKMVRSPKPKARLMLPLLGSEEWLPSTSPRTSSRIVRVARL